MRAIVNGSSIIQLTHRQPSIIECTQSTTTFVVTNGFHYSPTLEVSYDPGRVYLYQVTCPIDDIFLFTGIFISLLLFGIYILTSLWGLMVAANLPILYMLSLFYIDRKTFIELKPVGKI